MDHDGIPHSSNHGFNYHEHTADSSLFAFWIEIEINDCYKLNTFQYIAWNIIAHRGPYTTYMATGATDCLKIWLWQQGHKEILTVFISFNQQHHSFEFSTGLGRPGSWSTYCPVIGWKKFRWLKFCRTVICLYARKLNGLCLKFDFQAGHWLWIP